MKDLNIKSRHLLRKSQSKLIIKEIKKFFDDADTVFKKARFELVSADTYELLFVDGNFLFILIDGKPFFSVKGALKLQPKNKLITVDTGAVPFIIKGADIMRPGIISADPGIHEEDKVVIIEETHSKPIAVGYALMDGDQMIGDSGKAVKIVHRVGDRLWNLNI